MDFESMMPKDWELGAICQEKKRLAMGIDCIFKYLKGCHLDKELYLSGLAPGHQTRSNEGKF